MAIFTEIGTWAAPVATWASPTAAWDLMSFLQNAKSYIQTAGGALLMLLGAVGLVWGGVLLLKKLMGNPQTSQQTGWGTIVLLILVGGALGTGGWNLISTIGSGGQTTVMQLGGGTVIAQMFDLRSIAIGR